MSSASKIIKANDLVALKAKMDIENLDIERMARITSKSIGMSRKDCFHFLYKYSDKFNQHPDYNKIYLTEIIEKAANNDAIYVLEIVFNNPFLVQEDIDFQFINKSSFLHYRAIDFLVKNIDKKHFDNDFLYRVITDLFLKKVNKSKLKKIAELLFNNFNYNTCDFNSYLVKRSSKYYSLTFNGLLNFLFIYDKNKSVNNLSPFLTYMDKQDKDQFYSLLLTKKIINF